MDEFNFEAEETKQESENIMPNEAIVAAQENIAKAKLEEETRKIQACLMQAEKNTSESVKVAREASKKRNILKEYSEGIAKALTILKTDGDVKKYKQTFKDLETTKARKISEMLVDIWGDESWRHC